MTTKRRRLKIMAFVAVVVWMVVLLFSAIRLRQKSDQQDAKLVELKQFCVKTRNAIHADRLDLISTESPRQSGAFTRFYESDILYHNAASILMCIDAADMPTFPAMCWAQRDMTCMSEAAGRIEDALAAWKEP